LASTVLRPFVDVSYTIKNGCLRPGVFDLGRDDAIRYGDTGVIVQHDNDYQKDLAVKHFTANLVDSAQEQRFQEMIERGKILTFFTLFASMAFKCKLFR
jgi:hypothetical protein